MSGSSTLATPVPERRAPAPALPPVSNLWPANMDNSEAVEIHRSIVRESPNPIFLVDVETRRILDANPATLRLLRYEENEILRLDLYNVDLSSRERQDAMVGRVVREHHDILGERTYRRSDGTTIEVETSANLVIYGGRQVLCIFARDLTEKREAEQERQRLQRQLMFSQKHEAVGRLAAGIAHDFNNNLQVILLCAQLVRSRLAPGDESHQELEEVASAGNSAARLIRQLLAFSGKQRLRLKLVVMDDVVRGLEKMVRRIVGEDIDLTFEYGGGRETVLADPTQLEQVILNLVVNARDALLPHGRITISTGDIVLGEDFVHDYVTLAPGPHAVLKVADTGAGMDEETLSHIFDPFFTTKGMGKGTGLGLATVYGIVKQSGGSIWASSRPGAGTTFWIYFPVTTEFSEDEDAAQVPESAEAPEGTETILVVDDEDMVRVLTARILRDLGYSVIEAENPVEALRALQGLRERGEAEPDLVLTDVVMPRMSGPDLLAALRAQKCEAKVVFMTGYPQSYRDLGKDGRYLVLDKPLTRAVLAHAVRQALDS